jgi:hypothetical protein
VAGGTLIFKVQSIVTEWLVPHAPGVKKEVLRCFRWSRWVGLGMTPEKRFHELLGLGLNWEVAESRFDHKRGTILLEIRETERLWESVRCPEDGAARCC